MHNTHIWVILKKYAYLDTTQFAKPTSEKPCNFTLRVMPDVC